MEETGIEFNAFDLDLESNGQRLHERLKVLTKGSDHPFVYVFGEFLGGYDDLDNALAEGAL